MDNVIFRCSRKYQVTLSELLNHCHSYIKFNLINYFMCQSSRMFVFPRIERYNPLFIYQTYISSYSILWNLNLFVHKDSVSFSSSRKHKAFDLEKTKYSFDACVQGLEVTLQKKLFMDVISSIVTFCFMEIKCCLVRKRII